MAIDASSIRKTDDESRSAKYINIEIVRDELHRNFGGAIPKNSLILMEGIDGAGKSVMAQRITFGCIENNTSVTYISSELNTMTFLEQMDSMDYNVKFSLIDGKLLFIPMFPLMGRTTLAQDFFKRLMETEKIFKNEVIIFDTLSFLMVRDTISQSEVYDFINQLKRLTTLGKTIIFCVDPDHLSQLFLTLIRSVCDIYLKLELKKFAGNLIRVIGVQRFKRPMGDVITAIPFKIEPGKGLAIEIASLD
jgi:flagellar protein FlaH